MRDCLINLYFIYFYYFNINNKCNIFEISFLNYSIELFHYFFYELLEEYYLFEKKYLNDNNFEKKDYTWFKKMLSFF